MCGALVLLVFAGCSESQPRRLDSRAKAVADRFVEDLMKGDAADAASLLDSSAAVDLDRELAGFADAGITTFSPFGKGRISRGCVEGNPLGLPSPMKREDCVRYRLIGSTYHGRSEDISDARYTIWLRPASGTWRIADAEYSAEITFCAARCPEWARPSPSCVLTESGACVPLR
jgi:hypothetical protein